MPKKTKKQKLRTDSRKFLKSQTVSDIHYRTEKMNTSSPQIHQNQDSLVKDFVIKDLKKTLILTLFAILIELVLYWKWR